MDPIVLILTLAAVGALFLLNHMIGFYEPKRYSNIVEARDEWRGLNPDLEPGQGVVSLDGRTALLELHNSPSIGLVKSVGDKTATIAISNANLEGLYLHEEPANNSYRLKLKFNDPGFPRAAIIFPSASTAQDWLIRLNVMSPKSFVP